MRSFRIRLTIATCVIACLGIQACEPSKHQNDEAVAEGEPDEIVSDGAIVPSIYGEIKFDHDPAQSLRGVPRLHLNSLSKIDGRKVSVRVPYFNEMEGWKETSRSRNLVCAVDGSWKHTSYRNHSLKPGLYLVYVTSFDTLYAWRLAEANLDTPARADLAISLSNIGSVKVLLPAGWQDQVPADAGRLDQRRFLAVAPLESAFFAEHHNVSLPIRPLFPTDKQVTLRLPPGKYRIVYGALQGNVRVVAEETAKVTLKPSPANEKMVPDPLTDVRPNDSAEY